jgi:hypothetical protein
MKAREKRAEGRKKGGATENETKQTLINIERKKGTKIKW